MSSLYCQMNKLEIIFYTRLPFARCKNFKGVFLKLKYPEKRINSAIDRLQHPTEGVTKQSNEVTSNGITRNRVTGKKMKGSKISKSFKNAQNSLKQLKLKA